MTTESTRFNKPNTNLLYQEVISSIFRAILDGKLRPGERLVEETIAQELGVSRSPVRQALNDLENQGIIAIIPRKGAYVAQWSIDDIEDFIRVRIELEKQAAEYSAKRITPQEIDHLYSLVNLMIEATAMQSVVDQEILYDLAFHSQVVASSRNNTLIQIYSAIELRIHMYMIYEKYINPELGHKMGLVKAHTQVVDALKERDPNLAKNRIEESIIVAANEMVERMRKPGQQNIDGKGVVMPFELYID
jgi:DNA-binding GntR family transcriptional regulator